MIENVMTVPYSLKKLMEGEESEFEEGIYGADSDEG